MECGWEGKKEKCGSIRSGRVDFDQHIMFNSYASSTGYQTIYRCNLFVNKENLPPVEKIILAK